MATLAFSGFGTTWQDVLGLLGGDAYAAADVAKRKATVGAGSSTSAIVVTDTTGFAAADKININTGEFAAEGETVVIASITASVAGGTDGTLTLDADEGLLSAAPAAGDVVNDGPEVIERVMVDVEGQIEARLPSRYSDMLRQIGGEILARHALGSPTVFTLARAAADASGAGTQWANRTNGTVFLWESLSGRWADRWGKELDDADYEVSGQTVTLDASLSDGASLVAQYNYAMTAATAPKCLRQILRKLAAAEAGRIIGLDTEPSRAQYIDQLREEADAELERLGGGKQTIPELEKIELYEDTKHMPGITIGRMERA